MAFEIHPLDLKFQNFPEAIAAFLVIGPGGPVLIETGPSSTLPTLQAELARFGLRPADVRDVLITHIHLDHGGAAGWWARQGARIHVHHIGAPHLIDPARLLASAQRIYGETMQTLWGDYLSSPAERVHALYDGDVIEAGGLKITAFDTPGHARHHLLYVLDGVAFTGDLAGIRISARPHTRLPTPPPEFELEAWLASVARAKAMKFDRLYLTHFGPVDDVTEQWEQVAALLTDCAERVRAELERGADRNTIVARYTAQEEARLAADGLSGEDLLRYASIGPMGMSVDGLMRYWRKKMERGV
ncbi:MAG: MBL fold metallo-hydrolase [Anaerolineales bacterium]|nr:MBL fold metallo-hydrolase [Anaerolineales bacterium]